MPKFFKLTISKIEKLTNASVVLTFNVPESLISTFQFKSGQYLSLEVEIDGKTVRRSYSICSAPHENLLQVGIKKIENGIFSASANDTLKEGDVLNVYVPEGRFVYIPKNRSENICAYAAGSGITPIISILKTVLNANPKNKFQLVYGNKSVEQTMFYDTLRELAEIYENQLSIIWVFSRANLNEALFGRIDKSVVHSSFNKTNKYATRFSLKKRNKIADAYYICGPQGMVETTLNTLQELKVPNNRVFRELFYVKSGSSIPTNDQTVALTIIYDDIKYSVNFVKGKTILDVALQQKIEVPYSCQGGVCSSCIARIVKGSAKMSENQILTDTEVKEGLILTCQATATSSTLVVDYDDV